MGTFGSSICRRTTKGKHLGACSQTQERQSYHPATESFSGVHAKQWPCKNQHWWFWMLRTIFPVVHQPFFLFTLQAEHPFKIGLWIYHSHFQNVFCVIFNFGSQNFSYEFFWILAAGRKTTYLFNWTNVCGSRNFIVSEGWDFSFQAWVESSLGHVHSCFHICQWKTVKALFQKGNRQTFFQMPTGGGEASYTACQNMDYVFS